MIKSQTIEEIKSRMDIYEVVSDFVALKKSGSSYKALSPFTNEKTPSFMVSPAKGIFKCFSTGKGGDAITFLMEVDGLSYLEALKYLAQKYAIAIEEDEADPNYLAEQSIRESLFITLNFAKDHFVKNLWETNEGKSIGLSYYKERGFSEETIRRFDLGYSLDQWQGLMDAAKSAGYKDEFLEQTGLKIVKEDKAYDRFRGRVVFPIHNITGKVIAFGARTLKSNEKGPKYINSPETELYTKSKILYGIFQAKNEIRNQENCYLVEGYTDVVSLSQAGITNVVASSGTSLTEEQIKLIQRYTKNVTVLFDGDKAGIKASMRGIDMMLTGGLNVKAVPFPEGEDPDSYSKKLGGMAFKEYLDDNAQDFIAFKTGVFLKDGGDDPIKKAESIREIVHSISLIPDPIKRTVYIQECSRLLHVDEGTLISETNKLLLKSSKEKWEAPMPELPPEAYEPQQNETNVSRDEIIQVQERESIRMLLNYGAELIDGLEGDQMHLADYFMSESEDITFETPIYSQILEIFKTNLANGEVTSIKDFLDHNDPEIKRAAVDLSTDRYEISANWSEKFQINVAHESQTLKNSTYTNILRLKFRIIQKMIAENMENLKSASEEEQINKFLSIQGDLKSMEMTIAKILGNVTVK
ncbi:DNA primase [Reichenbachiella carrageenanivorans]|uniref:DNA primase n=1 Tax=Reichenbachiella carrageenanivorans TaxID=2979869 RepID=A0ABY6D123_9BACT|nr:DNA primase [Reichenbachiella carrageenanivorans]UXX78763.1 DNA primase [Reichenbachiella carrageenanivorans]